MLGAMWDAQMTYTWLLLPGVLVTIPSSLSAGVRFSSLVVKQDWRNGEALCGEGNGEGKQLPPLL